MSPSADPTRDELSAVRIEQNGSTLHVTLHRPEKLNALRPADIGALHRVMTTLDDSVRAVVFSGSGGRAFTAGMHVDTFAGLTPDTGRAFISGVRDALAAIRTAPVATVCAVDGYCVGVGFELALACDIRLATPGSSFGLPEIKVGVPSVVDAALLSQYVGLSLAKEIVLTGDLYPVDRFASSGMCNEIVEPTEMAAAVSRWVARVGGHTRTVTASQKRLLEVWQNTGLATGTLISVQEFGSVIAAEETHEQLATYRKGL
jgi:enoyl-CoA hydratase/carnithine racemase